MTQTWVKCDSEGYVIQACRGTQEPEGNGVWILCNHFLWPGVPGRRYNIHTEQWTEIPPYMHNFG